MSNSGVDRRGFLGALGAGSVGAMLAGRFAAGPTLAAQAGAKKKWQAVSDRKVRVGIVGYGYCRFGAQFGFQDHPNVEIVAVSDLIPDRREGLMKACRCGKSYESLEVLVKDARIEAVFLATDAPSHARHSIDALKHGKHVMSAVPATYGSIEEGEMLLETVRKTGLKYQMAETSCFREDCYAMRRVYHAGGFGRLVYSEGEYFHHCPKPLPSYKGWRVGSPPLWYPTHSTAYYVGVTGKRFTAVSCAGFRAGFDAYKPGANRYNNEFTDEVALFQTSEGGTSRMCMCNSVVGYHAETGRVFGEKGCMSGTQYRGGLKRLGDISRPPLPPGVPTGGHGGSHGPLMNEFITAILEDRQPLVNVYEALAMSVPGIVAHNSALRDGETLKVPQYLPPA
ncbi:MAG: Gfo/Idh/MocA family oxidoreductase [Phycisphaerae bacterium]